jgi:hypothetical protein
MLGVATPDAAATTQDPLFSAGESSDVILQDASKPTPNVALKIPT